ncbi:hypothetical protein Tco_0672080 [Tanacetum coccineum]
MFRGSIAGRLPDAGSGYSQEFKLREDERTSRGTSSERVRLQLRMEMIEHDMEALQARVNVAEQRADILQLALEDAGAETAELQTRSEDSEARNTAVRLRLHMIERLLDL